jgi:outer membrane protein
MKHLCALSSLLIAFGLYASEDARIGVVNFSSCVSESKAGIKEQEKISNIGKQMSSMIEETEKEIKEMSAKFEDTNYLDNLSPKAEEEMKLKYQTLQEDLARYQAQFNQVMQHAQHQAVYSLNRLINKSSEPVAKEKKLSCVVNSEFCFYVNPDLDITESVIKEMDKIYDAKSEEEKNQDKVESTTAIPEHTDSKENIEAHK